MISTVYIAVCKAYKYAENLQKARTQTVKISTKLLEQARTMAVYAVEVGTDFHVNNACYNGDARARCELGLTLNERIVKSFPLIYSVFLLIFLYYEYLL